MAFSPLRSKTLHHGRSLSLPSGSHPTISQFDENLSRVRSSEATSSSLSSLNEKVDGLNNLYDSMDDLLQLSGLKCEEKSVEVIVDDYIRLLDCCSAVKDLISLTKQDVRDLLSAVRRKDILNGIQNYLSSRRKSKKMIQKSLKGLRSKNNIVSLEKDNEKMGLVYILKDAESVTLSIFESLLAYIMGSSMQERKSGWSLVSNLIHSKKEADYYSNEFNKVDSFLQTSQESEELVNDLKDMESNVQILEEELEFLFRKLIKTRAFLLNILNH